MRGSLTNFWAIVDRLAGIALAVLEDVLDRRTAGGFDLVDGEVEAVLPLGAILRVRPCQRTADADDDRLGREAAANGQTPPFPGRGLRGRKNDD